MNNLPPNHEPPDAVDDHYRRLSALDRSRPSETVRQAVLEHAARLAAARRAAGTTRFAAFRNAALSGWRRPALVGSLAAAVVAGLVVVPLVFSSRVRPEAESGSVTALVARREEAPAQQSPPIVTETRSVRALPTAPPAAPGESALQQSRQSARVPAPAGRARAKAPAAADELTPPLVALAAPSQRPGEAGADYTAAGGTSAGEPRTVESGPAALAAVASSSNAAPRAVGSGTGGEGATDAPAQLRHAAQAGDLKALNALLGKEMDIDARDSQGRTALLLATLHGQAAAVSALLERGADPNAADERGTTPLQAAIASHQSAIIILLQRYGARQ